MKCLFAIGCIFFCAITAKGQVSRFDAKTVNDSVIAKYNRGDYAGIYAMAGDAYKAQNRPGGLISDLTEDKKTTGNILSSVTTENLGKIRHFKWIGEKANLNFELWLNGATIIRFKFNDLTTQPGWPDVPPRTDNRLKTALDSVVQIYAALYL